MGADQSAQQSLEAQEQESLPQQIKRTAPIKLESVTAFSLARPQV